MLPFWDMAFIYENIVFDSESFIHERGNATQQHCVR